MKKMNLLSLKVLVLLTIPIFTNDLFSQGFIWEKIGPDSIYNVNDIECFGTSGVLVAAAPGMIYYSSNSGEDWEVKNDGLNANRNIYSLGIDSREIFFATDTYDIFKSNNQGNSWFIVSDSIPSDGFGSLFIGDNDFIYAVDLSGLYRSEDYGHSWIKTGYTPGIGPHTMSFDDNFIYSGSPSMGGGLFKSSDYGNTWTTCFLFVLESICSLKDGSLFGIYQDSSGTFANIFTNYGDSIHYQYHWQFGSYWDSILRFRDGTLYTINRDNNNLESGVIKSTDKGINWEPVGFLLDWNVKKIAIDSSGFIYAFVDGKGIYRYSGPTVPVELVNFSCSAVGGKVLLNWKTATETNNFGFEIEREGMNNSWSKIAFVEGHGTTTREHAYQFEDNPGPGIFRYRLKQIDLDGKYEIFTGDKVEITADEKYQLSAYPNSFNGEITLLFNIQEEGRGTVVIYDILGNEILKLSDFYNPGAVTKKVKMPENVSSGIYFVRLNLKNETRMKKILLMK